MSPPDPLTPAAACPRCGQAIPASNIGGQCPRCLVDVVFAPWLDSPSAPARGAAAVQPAAAFPLPHQVGDFELLEEIGRGGMGVVYRARQLSLRREVAVKTILAGPVANADAIARFHAEAEALARLHHPNIVAIHDIFEQNGLHCFAMEYVGGRNLAELTRDGALPPAVAARHVAEVATGIQFAHERGILHRDLKPSNILIDPTGRPRITDFGLAKRLNAEADLTYTGQLIGSPQYFAPEQLSARRGSVGTHTDIYSLGAVLYHLLTGRPPFQAETLEEVLLQVIDAEPRAPRALNPAIPRDLDTICLKCMEKDPSRRYSTAREVAEDLERFLNEEPIRARPVGRPERLWRWSRKRIGLLTALAAVVALGGAAVAAWMALLNTPDRRLARTPTVSYHLRDADVSSGDWRRWRFTAGFGTNAAVFKAGRRVHPPTGRTLFRFNSDVPPGGRHALVLANFSQRYEPHVRGPIDSLDLEVEAGDVEGVGNISITPCIVQDGKYYFASAQGLSTGGSLAVLRFQNCRATQFIRHSLTVRHAGEHPDFSSGALPLHFGLAIHDADNQGGHQAEVFLGAVSVTVHGHPPTMPPYVDGEFQPADWTQELWNPPLRGNLRWRSEERVERRRSGGNSGACWRIETRVEQECQSAGFHILQSGVYAPGLQGALAEVDVQLDVRLAPDIPGRQTAYPTISPVLVQDGAFYISTNRAARPAYTPDNGGWQRVTFNGLAAHHFARRFGGTNPVFSATGGVLRFGFAVHYYSESTALLDTAMQSAIDIDNFQVDVRRAAE